MRVLYIGKFKKETATEHIVARALTSTGCSVAKVDYTSGAAPRKILKTCSPMAPDFALFSKSLDLNPGLIRGLPMRKAMWIFDGLRNTYSKMLREDGRRILKRARLMDVVFTVARCDLELYRAAGCRKVVWLLQGVDEMHNRYFPGKRTKGPVFIGNGYGSYREKFLSGVRKLGSSVLIYGKRWRIASNRSVSMLDVSKIYSRAKCAIGMGEIMSAEIDQFSCRVWHVMGSRCVLLHKRIPSLEALFREGEHLFFWNNERECHELIQRMKKDAKTRERVALNAYREVHGKHTYRHRIKVVLDTIRGLR